MMLDTTTPIRERLAHAYPPIAINRDFENRRRELAEARYGEPVEFVHTIGYVGLSELYKYAPVEVPASEPLN
jgi:hypothetical protein